MSQVISSRTVQDASHVIQHAKVATVLVLRVVHHVLPTMHTMALIVSDVMTPVRHALEALVINAHLALKGFIWLGTLHVFPACDFSPNLVSLTYLGSRYCNLCQSPNYALTNNSCLTTCPDYFITQATDSYITCGYPCNNTNQYLYQNGSCLSVCSSPFSYVNEGGFRFCRFICPLTSYLFLPSTCATTCAFPYNASNISIYQYCGSACSTSKFLYWNGSCLSTCSSPLSSSFPLALTKFVTTPARQAST